MKEKFIKSSFFGINFLIVILLFTIADYFIHGLSDAWSVPDYYFKNKIPFGFLWVIVGFLFSRKFENIWIKALVVALVVAVTLQFRYFLEGYSLSFVFLFLLIHFVIIYPLSILMFLILNKNKL